MSSPVCRAEKLEISPILLESSPIKLESENPDQDKSDFTNLMTKNWWHGISSRALDQNEGRI